MSVAPTKTITYREAMREAIREALLADERVFLMGEDVGAYGGCFGVSRGLLDKFGPDRSTASKVSCRPTPARSTWSGRRSGVPAPM